MALRRRCQAYCADRSFKKLLDGSKKPYIRILLGKVSARAFMDIDNGIQTPQRVQCTGNIFAPVSAPNDTRLHRSVILPLSVMFLVAYRVSRTALLCLAIML